MATAVVRITIAVVRKTTAVVPRGTLLFSIGMKLTRLRITATALALGRSILALGASTLLMSRTETCATLMCELTRKIPARQVIVPIEANTNVIRIGRSSARPRARRRSRARRGSRTRSGRLAINSQYEYDCKSNSRRSDREASWPSLEVGCEETKRAYQEIRMN